MNLLDRRILLVDELLYDLALAEERIVDVSAERDSYRDVARAALHSLADLTTTHDRLQSRHRELLASLRESTGQVAA